MSTILEEGDEDTSTISGQSSNNIGKKRVYQQISQNDKIFNPESSFTTGANGKRIKSDLNKTQINNSNQNKIIPQISSKTQSLLKEILKNQNKGKAPE